MIHRALPVFLVIICISCDTGKTPSGGTAIDEEGSETTSEDFNKGNDSDTNPGDPASDDNSSDSDVPSSDLADEIDESSLLTILEALASDEMGGRDEGSPGAEAARELITDRLRDCGIAPAGINGYEQSVANSKCINVIGRIDGRDQELQDQHILLSAHYDHVGECDGKICNGAYDNAAAVAAVIEIACVLQKHPGERPLLIALWDCEEPPTFRTSKMGSEYFASNPVVPLDTISASIVLDLFGAELWPGFNGVMLLGTESSDTLRSLVNKLEPEDGLESYTMGLHAIEEQPYGHQPFSDYDAFRNRKVPVIFVSDGKNKTYHEPTDDWEHIVQDKFLLETRFIFQLTRTVQNSEENPTWQGHPHLGMQDLEEAITVGNIALGKTDVPGLIETLKLSSRSKSKLKGDIEALETVRARLEKTPGDLTTADIKKIRTAAQRLMCLAASNPAEILCQLL